MPGRGVHPAQTGSFRCPRRSVHSTPYGFPATTTQNVVSNRRTPPSENCGTSRQAFPQNCDPGKISLGVVSWDRYLPGVSLGMIGVKMKNLDQRQSRAPFGRSGEPFTGTYLFIYLFIYEVCVLGTDLGTGPVLAASRSFASSGRKCPVHRGTEAAGLERPPRGVRSLGGHAGGEAGPVS